MLGFARSHAARIEFFQYLQWQAELQIAAVEERCFDAGLAIGLYTDLAVSVDPGGADAWANQDLYVQAATVGAPPDEFNMNGQNWGLPPLAARALSPLRGYAAFIATAAREHGARGRAAHRSRHGTRAAVSGCRRAWTRSAGAYVNYAFAEALGILALESHRHRCIVIGEDLGTVPDELRAGLAQAGVLSYRLLIFEHDADGDFNPPRAYPRQALAAVTTHDLPTLAGFWRGRDQQLRAELGQFPDAAKRDAQFERARTRARGLAARTEARAAAAAGREHPEPTCRPSP